MQLPFEQVVEHLRRIKAEHGDESFHQALKGLFRALLQKPGSEQYIQRLLTELSVPATVDDMKAEIHGGVHAQKAPSPASPASPVEIVRQAIEQSMPNCRTQAHFDLVVQAWDALRLYLNAVYGFDKETAEKALYGLEQLLELAPKVAGAHESLKENPEATTNLDYVSDADELTEHHKQKTLLAELEDVDSMPRLQEWYRNSRPIMDTIVTQGLRDELFDLIRAKKQALVN